MATTIKRGDMEAAAGKMHGGAHMTAAKRAALPKAEFGLPAQRKYPMPDPSHAANAKARATQQVQAGKLTSSAKAQIDAKANKVLGKGR